ncbi:MAG: tyrosine--tRNA ligase [Phycisphaerales bacterium]|nr:tyrosine--tRNA ligase [Phycisphaerales bacterium]
MSERIDLINELEWRGLLKDCTDNDGLRAHLADPDNNPRKIYAGFDPTADSLTIGNLVPIMLLAHVKRAGHCPVVVMGGGTGLIGDPSGKSAERQLNTIETIEHFVDCQRPIYNTVLDQIEGPSHSILNNHDWLGKISYIEALRDIGKHFSVNMMMQKESVKERLNNREQGISYTEFSYMILQAFDFSHLYEHEGVTVQIGGSDQYGNIIAGSDLIRRISAAEGDDACKSFGLTAPLVQKADGGKFGKTEVGAIWLTAARTSPYAYYQFWLNATDEDATGWIKVFTFLDQTTVEELIARHQENPGKRELQRTLAQEATRILHGQSAMENAEAAGKALFSGEIAALDAQTMLEVFASVPTTEHAKSELNDGVDMVGLLKDTNLATSNREAKEFLNEGSVSINGTKITLDTKLTQEHLLHESYIAVRRGKKKWHMTKWS